MKEALPQEEASASVLAFLASNEDCGPIEVVVLLLVWMDAF